jgi:hypothetical protein
MDITSLDENLHLLLQASLLLNNPHIHLKQIRQQLISPPLNRQEKRRGGKRENNSTGAMGEKLSWSISPL